MSKGIRRPPLSSSFETKRVIVAACAGIAMILGATSVGAGIGSPPHVAAPRNSTNSAGNAEPLQTRPLQKQKTLKVLPANNEKLTTLVAYRGRNFFEQPKTGLYTIATETPNIVKKINTAVFSGTTDPAILIKQLSQTQVQAGKDSSPPASLPVPGTTVTPEPSDQATSEPPDTTPVSSPAIIPETPPETITEPLQPQISEGDEPISTLNTEADLAE